MFNRPAAYLEIVDSLEEFDAASAKYSPNVKLSSKEHEEAYIESDDKLAEKIDRKLEDMLSKENKDVMYHQNYDWWRNKTRFLELDASIFRWELVKNMQKQLSRQHRTWVINIHIYDPLSHPPETPSKYVGAMNIYAYKVLVTRSLIALLDKTS